RVEMTELYIRQLIERARKRFPDFLPQAEERLRQGLEHKKTPPRDVHALADLTIGLERNIDALQRGGREVDVNRVLDLRRALDLYDRWSADPAFPGLLATAISTFRHDVVLLAGASVLADSG